MGKRNGNAARIACERLERRYHFTLTIPPQPTVSITYTPDTGGENIASIRWTDNNTEETGYRVEWSLDGLSNWQTLSPAGGGDWPAGAGSGGTREATQVLNAGQDYSYRVRAIENTTVTDPSPSKSPTTPKDWALQVTATVGPPAHDELGWHLPVTLQWPQVAPFPYGSSPTIDIYRKAREDVAFELIDSLPGLGDTQYIDKPLREGMNDPNPTWEYKVHVDRVEDGGHVEEYGFVHAGWASDSGVPELMDNRGTVLLVVDQEQEPHLTDQLDRLAYDLIGDGWRVQRITAPRDDDDALIRRNVREVKNQIRSVYNAHPDLKTVILIGHVPVPYSGLAAFDGHGAEHGGAFGADAYYGEMGPESAWNDLLTDATPPTHQQNWNRGGPNPEDKDGKFDQIDLPSTPELAVGRIDFSRMEWTDPDDPRTETQLLQRYLDKDHEFRQRLFAPQRRALIDDHFGSGGAANAWMTFSPLVGTSNVFSRDWNTSLRDDDNPATDESYLWAYGGGPGSHNSAAGIVQKIGFNGAPGYDDGVPYGSVFNFLFGSWFYDFDLTYAPGKSENLLRAALANNGSGLISIWNAVPDALLHSMGMGEPIGASFLTSQQDSLTHTYSPTSSGGLQQAIMGDPTLRMHYVAPPGNIVVMGDEQGNVVWQPPQNETVYGYRVYKTLLNFNQPWEYLGCTTSTGWQDPNFTNPDGQFYDYMVRTVKLEQTPTGTYWNLSTGAFSRYGDVIFDGEGGEGGEGLMAQSGSWYPNTSWEGFETSGTPPIFDELADIWWGDQHVSDSSKAALTVTDPGSASLGAGASDFALVFTDGLQHTLTLRLQDDDQPQRVHRIEIFDDVTGRLLDRREVSDIGGDGKSLTWRVRGRVRVSVAADDGGAAAVQGVWVDQN